MKKLWYSTILAGATLFLVVAGTAFAHDDRYDDSYHHGYGRHHHRYHQHRHVRHYHDGDYCSDPSVHYRRGYRKPAVETRVVVPALPLPPLPHHLLFKHWFGH
jgi:hypothetical protein